MLSLQIVFIFLIPILFCVVQTSPTKDTKSRGTGAGSSAFCPVQLSRPVYYKSSDRWEAEVTGAVSSPGDLLPDNLTDICSDRSSRWRSYDGTCNNYANRGSAFRPLARLLDPAYDDDLQSPRRLGTNCQPLPNVREVSKALHPAKSSQRGYTPMLAAWSQFFDHDITSLPVPTDSNATLKCCGPNNSEPYSWLHADCLPIKLEDGEQDFAGACMEFLRTMSSDELSPNRGGIKETRQQVNAVTSFIDGSHIYGSSEARAHELRNGHLLKTKVVNDEEFPPELTGSKADSCIKRVESNDFCFDTGDGRGNENPGQAALHTVFLREHNRLANAFKSAQPQEFNISIFEESRRIVIAMIQKITFVDYLPKIVGKDLNNYGLYSHKARSKFNPSVDATISNAFATVGMKTLSSQISNSFPVGDNQVPLATVFNSPGQAIDNLDNVLQGMCGGSKNLSTNLRPRAEVLDENFAEALTKHYYEPKGKQGYGLDFVALTIQRGRDHGLPPYTKWREYCSLRPLTGFDDVEALGPNVAEFGKIYNSVEDIDLFPALLHEPAVNGQGGPTLNCLLTLGFFRLKFGDRHFFTTDDPALAFTDIQLAALRLYTLAHMICENTNIDYLPRDVFQLSSPKNPMSSCQTLKAESLNLSLIVQVQTRL